MMDEGGGEALFSSLQRERLSFGLTPSGRQERA
jgi:hypothetical protein